MTSEGKIHLASAERSTIRSRLICSADGLPGALKRVTPNSSSTTAPSSSSLRRFALRSSCDGDSSGFPPKELLCPERAFPSKRPGEGTARGGRVAANSLWTCKSSPCSEGVSLPDAAERAVASPASPSFTSSQEGSAVSPSCLARRAPEEAELVFARFARNASHAQIASSCALQAKLRETETRTTRERLQKRGGQAWRSARRCSLRGSEGNQVLPRALVERLQKKFQRPEPLAQGQKHCFPSLASRTEAKDLDELRAGNEGTAQTASNKGARKECVFALRLWRGRCARNARRGETPARRPGRTPDCERTEFLQIAEEDSAGLLREALLRGVLR